MGIGSHSKEKIYANLLLAEREKSKALSKQCADLLDRLDRCRSLCDSKTQTNKRLREKYERLVWACREYFRAKKGDQ